MPTNDTPIKKPGPKEAQLRALRESKASGQKAAKVKAKALSSKVATVKAARRGGEKI